MKVIALLSTIAGLALVALAGPATAGAAVREYEGTVVSVNRDAKTFRLRDSERGTIRIKVKRSTRFERLSGFSALRAGMSEIEVDRAPHERPLGRDSRSSAPAAAATTAATTTTTDPDRRPRARRCVPGGRVPGWGGCAARRPPRAASASWSCSPPCCSPPRSSAGIAGLGDPAARRRPHRAAAARRRRRGGRRPLRVALRPVRGLPAPRRGRHEPPALPALARRRGRQRGRTARWRPQVESAARAAGVDPDTLEGLVFLESAGRDGRADAGRHRGRRRAHADPRRDRLEPARDEGRHDAQRPLHAADRARGAARRRRRGERPCGAPARRSTSASTPARRSRAPPATSTLARKTFGREDLAFVCYHMGIGNLEDVLRAFSGETDGTIADVVDDQELSYARVYFDSTPKRHAAAYQRLAGLGDDSANYFWKVAARARDHAPVARGPRRAGPARRPARGQELRRGGAAPGRLGDALRRPGRPARGVGPPRHPRASELAAGHRPGARRADGRAGRAG